MSDYALGMSTGLILGMAIFMPGGSEMTVKLDREDAKALKSGVEISMAVRQRTCSRIEQALQDFRKNKTDVIKICAEDLRQDMIQSRQESRARRSPSLTP